MAPFARDRRRLRCAYPSCRHSQMATGVADEARENAMWTLATLTAPARVALPLLAMSTRPSGPNVHRPARVCGAGGLRVRWIRRTVRNPRWRRCMLRSRSASRRIRRGGARWRLSTTTQWRCCFIPSRPRSSTSTSTKLPASHRRHRHLLWAWRRRHRRLRRRPSLLRCSRRPELRAWCRLRSHRRPSRLRPSARRHLRLVRAHHCRRRRCRRPLHVRRCPRRPRTRRMR